MSDYSIPGPTMRQGEPPGPYDSAISDRLMGLVKVLSQQQQNPGDFPVEDLMAAQRMGGFPSPMDAEVSTLGPRVSPASGVPSSWPAGMKNKRVGYNLEQGAGGGRATLGIPGYSATDPLSRGYDRYNDTDATRTMRYRPQPGVDLFSLLTPGSLSMSAPEGGGPNFAMNYGETVPSFMLGGPPGGTLRASPEVMARSAMDSMRPGSGGEGRMGNVVSGDDALMDAMVAAMRGGPKTSSMRSGPSEADLARIPTRAPLGPKPSSGMPDFSVNPADMQNATPAMLMAIFGSGGPRQEVSSVQTPSRNPVRRPYAPPGMMSANMLNPSAPLPAQFRRPTRR